MAPSPIDKDMAELVIPSLPLETRCPPFPLRQYGGFWMPEPFLPGMAAARAGFQPRPSDVVLASFPKSGTTWLKALAFATLNRADHPPCGLDHPLRRRNPHDCVDFLEVVFLRSAADDVLAALPSPRVIATHMPCSLLPERVTAEGAGCKVVYVCREPKDMVVSRWHFHRRLHPELPFADVFEAVCSGAVAYGPAWDHMLGYWSASTARPDSVLFLRYEDLLRDPAEHVRALARFVGLPFSGAEEDAGVGREEGGGGAARAPATAVGP